MSHNGLDEDSFRDDGEYDFFDLDLDEQHDPFLRRDFSFSSLELADGDISSGDGTSPASAFWMSRGARTAS